MPEKREAYLCVSAMLRAKEPLMLNQEKADRMLDAGSFDEAAKLLTDCGYDDMSGMNSSELDAALADHRKKVFGELERYAPADGITDYFKIKYDYHNAKAVLKAEATGTDPERLFSASGRIPGEKLASLYAEEKYSSLPGLLPGSMQEAKQVLARSSNPQMADFILDRAYFAELKETAEKSGCGLLKKYTSLTIDAANLKSAVRTLRMNKGPDFMVDALVPGGNIDADRILAAGDGDGIRELFARTGLENAAVLGAEAASGAGSLSAFEKACDNALNLCLKSAKLVSFGPEVVTAFAAAKENEITAVRMILSGLLSGIAPDRIRERLRDSYA